MTAPLTDAEPLDLDAIEARFHDPRTDVADSANDVPALAREVRRLREREAQLVVDKRRCHGLLQGCEALIDPVFQPTLLAEVTRELAGGCEPGSCTDACDAEAARLREENAGLLRRTEAAEASERKTLADTQAVIDRAYRQRDEALQQEERLRGVLRDAEKTLTDFRAYYVADNRLGGKEDLNHEVRRADATLAQARAALGDQR